MDEPFNGLDAPSRDIITGLIGPGPRGATRAHTPVSTRRERAIGRGWTRPPPPFVFYIGAKALTKGFGKS